MRNDKAFVRGGLPFYFCDILSRFRDIGQNCQNLLELDQTSNLDKLY